MGKLKELQLILEEVLDQYGWTLKYDLVDETKIEEYKNDFIEQFSKKCCNNLILENSDDFTIIKRVQNV